MATEYWMSGPVDNIPALLQPVAHALLQANLEINHLMQDFPEEKLWERPAGVASPGFHLQHVSGVLDRLCTYARAEALSEAQLAALKAEGTPGATLHDLLEQFDVQVHKTLLQLSATPENTLTEFRGVGRKQLPSTVLGLLFHAAEHTMRHTGQLLVTVKVLS
ncbi:DinB family protein [Chitinophaga polysaccharea]|uniref:DinB family protein n=1 Tax=Chitinophaga polysaccharea TaxID=1293035 RepID=UPI0014551758|nr:DinB family protein [Chitinophaga polysaccharea]NLR57217.1 DinB family protein [Chitinophaga polysaccharea]